MEAHTEGDDIVKGAAERKGKKDRIPTGVEGFDDLVEGGIPRGSNVLITGLPGTGKTLFSLNYLYRGAQLGENGLYVSIDSSSEQLKLEGMRFNWDLDGMEKAGKLFFLRVPLGKIKVDLFDVIEKVKKEINAERIVLDNLATFAINADFLAIKLNGENVIGAPTPFDVDRLGDRSAESVRMSGIVSSDKSDKRMAYLIIEKLAELGTTNLIVTYGNRNSSHITVDGVSEFTCDGVVELYNELIGNKRIRTMSILKMRGTDHSQYLHEFDFGKNGIVIKPAHEVYK